MCLDDILNPFVLAGWQSPASAPDTINLELVQSSLSRLPIPGEKQPDAQQFPKMFGMPVLCPESEVMS